jgi:hypothetical protein
MEGMWIFFTFNNKQTALFAAKMLASLAGKSMLVFCDQKDRARTTDFGAAG